MGLLDKLWDDTLAGPQPDTGLGRLRKFSNFSIRTDLSKESEGMNVSGKSGPDSPLSPTIEGDTAAAPRVTRSIMIRRPAGSPSAASSPPVSPAGSTPPLSPFFGGGGSVGREWRFRRRSMSDAYERRSTTAPPTPTGSAAAATGGVGSRRADANPFDV